MRWGVIGITDEKGEQLNPLQYRGYYMDKELGFYYLQSRYYMAPFSRFLNADDPDIARQSKADTAGMNLFAYCNNDPVNHSDPTGYWKKDVHSDWTLNWIKSSDYNSGSLKKLKPYASKIAQYCKRLDIDYPSTYYASHLWDTASKQWQYFHFNGNKTGTDSRIKYSNDMMTNAVNTWKIAESTYKKECDKVIKKCKKPYSNHLKQCKICQNNTKKYRNQRDKQRIKALLYLGYGLHAIQDIEAHGQIGRGKNIPEHVTANKDNRQKADVTKGWEWTDGSKNALKKVSGSTKRKESTRNATKKYLKRFSNAIWG